MTDKLLFPKSPTTLDGLSEDDRNLVSRVVDFSRTLLSRDGELFPVAFVITPKDNRVLPLDFSDRPTKHSTLQALAAYARDTKARLICIVTEAWAISRALTDPLDIAPGDAPDRKEIVCFSVETLNTAYVGHADFDRSSGTPTFGDVTWMEEDDTAQGSLIRLLPRSGRN